MISWITVKTSVTALQTFCLSAPYVTLVADFFHFISFSVSLTWDFEFHILLFRSQTAQWFSHVSDRLYWMAACDRSVQTEISEQLLHGSWWTSRDSPCFPMMCPHNFDDPLTFSRVPQRGWKYLKNLNVWMTAIKIGTDIHVPLKMDCIDFCCLHTLN